MPTTHIEHGSGTVEQAREQVSIHIALRMPVAQSHSSEAQIVPEYLAEHHELATYAARFNRTRVQEFSPFAALACL